MEFSKKLQRNTQLEVSIDNFSKKLIIFKNHKSQQLFSAIPNPPEEKMQKKCIFC